MARTAAGEILTGLAPLAGELEQVYIDLHAHPELSMQEVRTSGVVAQRLSRSGFVVLTGIGGTGVVGLLANGDGPVVMMRADMDGLPVREATGLDYASTQTVLDDEGLLTPVMHACGHDMHVTCLLGAAQLLAVHSSGWAGTLVVVFQPAEETGAGARAMIEDGLFDRVPRPDIVLGQHVAPHPAGLMIHQTGPVLAAADTLAVTLFGRGAHASAPELSVDPIVMAASVITRLQTIVSREVEPDQPAVVTVGAISAGNRGNIIPDSAELLVDVRTFSAQVRDKVLAAIRRIVDAESTASGATRLPEVTTVESLPPTVNDPAATERVIEAFGVHFGPHALLELDPSLGSEDFGLFGQACGAPSVFWFFGGGDPERYARAERQGRLAEDIASNHSPHYAPVIEPTLSAGVSALVVAGMTWLASNP